MLQNNEMILKLKNEVISIKVNLDSVLSSLDLYQDTANIMLKLESINKTRRYGRSGFIQRYIQSPNKNVSSHMRLFLYHKAMEQKLLEMAQILKNKIYEIEFEILRLESGPIS